MNTHARPLVCGALAAALLSITAAAAAEAGHGAVERVYRDGETGYRFRDDLLGSDVSTGHVPTIRVRKEAWRVLLIRPRAHFVTELQRSVEAL